MLLLLAVGGFLMLCLVILAYTTVWHVVHLCRRLSTTQTALVKILSAVVLLASIGGVLFDVGAVVCIWWFLNDWHGQSACHPNERFNYKLATEELLLPV